MKKENDSRLQIFLETQKNIKEIKMEKSPLLLPYYLSIEITVQAKWARWHLAMSELLPEERASWLRKQFREEVRPVYVSPVFLWDKLWCTIKTVSWGWAACLLPTNRRQMWFFCSATFCRLSFFLGTVNICSSLTQRSHKEIEPCIWILCLIGSH